MFFWLNSKSGDFCPVVNKYFIIKDFEEVEVIEHFSKVFFLKKLLSYAEQRRFKENCLLQHSIFFYLDIYGILSR